MKVQVHIANGISRVKNDFYNEKNTIKTEIKANALKMV